MVLGFTDLDFLSGRAEHESSDWPSSEFKYFQAR